MANTDFSERLALRFRLQIPNSRLLQPLAQEWSQLGLSRRPPFLPERAAYQLAHFFDTEAAVAGSDIRLPTKNLDEPRSDLRASNLLRRHSLSRPTLSEVHWVQPTVLEGLS